MKRVVGLIRVSSEDQKDEGYGIPEQADKIQQYITNKGYYLVEPAGFATPGIDPLPGFFQEDYVGTTPFRPAVKALQDAIAAHRIEVVVLHRTNRLGRRGSVQQVLEADFRARGVKVEYTSQEFDTDNHYGRFIRNVMGSVDELDFEQIVSQLRNGREQAAKKGSIVLARPPFGYRIVKAETDTGRIIRRLEIVEEEAEMIRQAYEWYVYDGWSMAQIAAEFTRRKVLTRWDSSPDRRGIVGGMKKRSYPVGTWDESRIYRMLTSDTYMGKWAWGKTKTVPIPGTDKVKQVPTPKEDWIIVPVPPIVDEELFASAMARIDENRRLNKRHQRYTYLFVGMLTCGNCGYGYFGFRWSDTSPYRYRCGSKRGSTRYTGDRCDMPNFTEEEIDAVIWPWIQEIVRKPEKVAEALEERQRQSELENASLLHLVTTTEKVLAELTEQRERVLTLYKRNLLDAERWAVEDRALGRQIEEQEAQKVKLLSQSTQTLYSPEMLSDIREACRLVGEGLEHFTRDEKREVYELLSLRGTLSQEGGSYIVEATCILDARRLAVKKTVIHF